jgi:alpha-glucosidase
MIPMQSPIQNTSEKPSDTLMVHLYYTAEPNDIEWEYYEDDGETYQYQDGKYYLRNMIYKPGINEVEFRPPAGDFESKFNFIQLIFHGFDDLEMAKFNGKPKRFEMINLDFQHAAEKANPDYSGTINCKSIIFQNEPNKFVINWR